MNQELNVLIFIIGILHSWLYKPRTIHETRTKYSCFQNKYSAQLAMIV